MRHRRGCESGGGLSPWETQQQQFTNNIRVVPSSKHGRACTFHEGSPALRSLTPAQQTGKQSTASRLCLHHQRSEQQREQHSSGKETRMLTSEGIFHRLCISHTFSSSVPSAFLFFFFFGELSSLLDFFFLTLPAFTGGDAAAAAGSATTSPFAKPLAIPYSCWPPP